MDNLITIKQMLKEGKIKVPRYQRAYSWDTELESTKTPKQVNTFLSDLEEHKQSSTQSKYYFGHFLFENTTKEEFDVIDGQQRLTTIIIFLSALFTRLKEIRKLSETEKDYFEDMIKRGSKYRFETIDYDNQFLKDYVIDQKRKDKSGTETQSSKRLADAFDFFSQKLQDKDEEYLLKMLEIIESASCSTHIVQNESEAIQMFLFQNNRGKKPSQLEIVKAEFMFNAHLHGKEEKEYLIKEIKSRFEKIYKSISSIEQNIDEDDVLTYTLRVYYNSLWESNSRDKISKELSKKDPIPFIKSFIDSLAFSFDYLKDFFGKDEKQNFEIHSLVALEGISLAIPFIIKAYKFGLADKLSQICSSLESLIIRQRLIGTRADINSRLNDVYQQFDENNTDIKPIIDKVEHMKNETHGWWAYWNNQAFEKALEGKISHSIAKFLLWKYENHITDKNGYSRRFDYIKKPELEHIAPQTENPEEGYDKYDDEFKNEYLECLGNYLLISKSHNCSIGNRPFQEKRATYCNLEQQREIQKMTNDSLKWTRDLILERKKKIIKVLMEIC